MELRTKLLFLSAKNIKYKNGTYLPNIINHYRVLVRFHNTF